jgi:hypothetical protein
MAANKHRAEHEAAFEGESFILRLDLSTISAWEEIYGCGFIELAQGKLGEAKLSVMVEAFCLAAESGGRDNVDRDHIADLVMATGVGILTMHLKSVLVIAFYGSRNVDKDGAPNPPTAEATD